MMDLTKLLVIVISTIFIIVFWTISHFFLYKISKLKENRYSWISWIPYLSIYNLFEKMKEEYISFFDIFYIKKDIALILFILWAFLPDFGNNLFRETLISLYTLFELNIYLTYFSDINIKHYKFISLITLLIPPLGMGLAYISIKLNKKGVKM